MTITRSAAASQLAFHSTSQNNNQNNHNNNNKILHSLTPPTLLDPNSPTAISYEDDSLGEEEEEVVEEMEIEIELELEEEEEEIEIVTEAQLLKAVVGEGEDEADEEDSVEGYSNHRVITIPSIRPAPSIAVVSIQTNSEDAQELPFADEENRPGLTPKVDGTSTFNFPPARFPPVPQAVPKVTNPDVEVEESSNGIGRSSQDVEEEDEMEEEEEEYSGINLVDVEKIQMKLMEDETALDEEEDDIVMELEEEEEEESDLKVEEEEEEEEEEEVEEEDVMEEEESEEEEEKEEEEEEEEESDIDAKSDGEVDAILQEMEALEEAVPMIKEHYKLIDRLGEGTFSSVYKAIDLRHNAYDNSGWIKRSYSSAAIFLHPREPSVKKDKGKVYVALKRIYVTSSPIRIHNELDILHELRGGANVAYIIEAIRFEDQVIAVMPFNRHQDFRSYYRHSSLATLRSYFYALFRALASTHSKSIIHRDVKPANFLYDVNTGTGVLCDYGLAQKIGGVEIYEWKAECCHSLPGPSCGGIEVRRKNQEIRKRESTLPGAENVAPGLKSGLHGVRLVKPLGLYQQALTMEQEWTKMEEDTQNVIKKYQDGTDPYLEISDIRRMKAELSMMKPWIMPRNYKADLKMKHSEKKSWYKSWRPSSMVGLVNSKQERVGYLKEDRRSNVRANRAGTRGFRAPEVLLKCPDQTVALDIWSAGIILLCFLTRRFPFFNSNDDTEALVEIAAMFGRRKMERCAVIHNRTFVTNITTLETPPHPTLHHLVKALNPAIIVENSPNRTGTIPSSAESDAEWYDGSDICMVIDLLKKTLELDCTKRWTAEECLEHPFFDGLFDLGNGVLGKRELGLLRGTNEY